MKIASVQPKFSNNNSFKSKYTVRYTNIKGQWQFKLKDKNRGIKLSTKKLSNVSDVLKVNAENANKIFTSIKNSIMNSMDMTISRYFRARWDYDINQIPENMIRLQQAAAQYDIILNDKDVYARLLNLKHSNSNYLSDKNKKILNGMIETSSLNKKNSNCKDAVNLRMNLYNKSNSFVPLLDGKPVSYGEIENIIESNSEKNKVVKAYSEVYKKGDLLAEDLRNLVIERNKIAQEKGYSNYYDYVMEKSYGITTSIIKDLINQLSKVLNNAVIESKSFDLDIAPEDIIKLTKDTYKNMGFDIDEYIKSGKLTLDLLPRKNKSILSASYPISPTSDTRILTNIGSNEAGCRTFFHELGHSLMFLNMIPENFFFGKENNLFNEAVATMMQHLPFKENIVSFPNKDSLLKYMFRILRRIEFEIGMYENPNRDLKQLWHDLSVKYKYYDDKKELNNEWATVPHYITHPAYYQNYLRASIMSSQLYHYLTSKLGKLSENHKTAEFLKENVFKLYMSEDENNYMKKITGKELSVEYLIRDLQ